MQGWPMQWCKTLELLGLKRMLLVIVNLRERRKKKLPTVLCDFGRHRCSTTNGTRQPSIMRSVQLLLFKKKKKSSQQR
eukprot:scaffold2395_cov105-Skeletonema_menzelii.AAC.3